MTAQLCIPDKSVMTFPSSFVLFQEMFPLNAHHLQALTISPVLLSLLQVVSCTAKGKREPAVQFSFICGIHIAGYKQSRMARLFLKIIVRCLGGCEACSPVHTTLQP
jgi:hypothetical protein